MPLSPVHKPTPAELSAPGSDNDLLYLSDRTRVLRLRLPNDRGSIIVKEPRGPAAVEKLAHEADIIRRLARVENVSRLAGAAVSANALALEDRGGVTLERVIAGARPEPGRLLELALQLARIIVGVHHAGIMHKDINPANILLAGTEQTAVLIDFDHATTFAEERPAFVHHREIAGNLAYLAPEQTGRVGRSLDQRADLYGLGATLYEVATGSPPFTESDPLALIHQILTRVPTPPAVLEPRLPALLSEIIMRLLEKEPDQRYQSAEGLVHDLTRLREMPAIDGQEGFSLGAQDFPLRLSSSSRLFGREGEIATLGAALDRACERTGGCVLVSGASGVGKSALIGELRALVTSRRGWYVAGKFDQYRHDHESGAVAQALAALGRLLLAEDEAALGQHRQRILKSLGSNAGLIASWLPEFSIILGIAPENASGDRQEMRVRLCQASLDLLAAVAAPDNPLVLVLDDLQWANQATIDFIDALLAHGGLPGLLLVGAYRREEIDASHPLSAWLSKWEGLADAPIRMCLPNLPTGDLSLLIGDVLRLAPEPSAELAEILAQRTDGNPNDTLELLNSLRMDRLLVLGQGGWNWNGADVRTYVGQHGVAELLAARIAALPPETVEQLQLMTCLGGELRLDLLAAAGGLTERESLVRLTPALEEGLLVMEQGCSGQARTGGDSIRFRHDRIQQAAHDTATPAERKRLHLNTGRRLARIPGFGYPAAEQYLEALDGIEASQERCLVAGLFHAAAAVARLSASYATVERFLAEAITLYRSAGISAEIPDGAVIETEWHASLCCLARFEQADQLYRSIESHCRDPLALVAATCVQINSLSNRDRQQEAVALGLGLLRQLGIPAPQRLDREIEQELAALFHWSADHTAEGELQRRETDDPRVIGAAKLLQRMMGPAFFYDPLVSAWLVLQSWRLWSIHGPSPALMAGLAGMPVVISALCNDYRTGYHLAQLALQLGEARTYEPETSWVRHCFALFSSHWQEPLERSIEQARLARQGLLRSGDLQYTCFTYHTSLAALLDCAASLAAFATELEAALAFARHTANDFSLQSFLACRQLLRALQGLTIAPGSFEDADFDEAAHLRRVATTPLATVTFHIHRALAAALFNDAPVLARHAAAAMPLLPHIQGFYPAALAHLLQALALAERVRGGAPQERAALLAELEICVEWLRSRAEDAPANFMHLLRLVEAERDWATGETWNAAVAFDAALREAGRQRRPWHQALLTERAALFHLSHGLEHIGRSLLGEARQLYLEWGAAGKVRQLESVYSFLRPTADSRPGAVTGQSSTLSNDAIDLIGIVRASQALSSETNLQRLKDRVVSLLAAMTGATRVQVVIRRDEGQGWYLMNSSESAAATIGLEEAGGQGLLPLSVVRYVERTLEPLLVEDGKLDDRFRHDPYLAGFERCSLLAVPILSQGSARAFLLLENRLGRNAFTTARLDAVMLIAGQLAVSLDNALLYDSLEQRVAERTAALEEEIAARGSAEELYRTLVEHSPDGILLVDPVTRKIVRFNSQAHQQLGFSSDEFARLNILDLEDPQTRSQTEAHFASLAETREASFETSHRTKQEQLRTILVRLKAVDNSGQALAHCIFRDITDKRKMEQELLKVRKLESVSVLAGGIAHDFNNLLTGIIGNISLAKMLVAPEARIHRLLTNAEKASQRAGILTNQLLTFAKGGAPVKRITAMGELIRECCATSLSGSAVRCDCSIAADLWPCRVDQGQISQAISNLIINAEQAMPDGGLISVHAANIELTPGSSLPLGAGSYLKIDVRDQGDGIPRELLASIFDPYFTTKQNRAGFGLTTTYSIMKSHGGLICVESETGVGTIFSLYLPANGGTDPDEGRAVPRTRESGKRILLMDDEKMILEIAGHMLDGLGFDSVATRDGAEAIAAYAGAMEAGNPFCAVIMDLTIPGGMGGKETIHKLLELDPAVKAIVSSGYSDDPVMSNFAAYGFSGILSKPYLMEDLRRLLATLC